MKTYKLTIITPEGEIHDDHVESMVAPGMFGSLGILANHAPMIVALTAGVLHIKDPNQEHYYAIESGVLEVNSVSEVLALIDKAVQCQSLDEAKVQVQNLEKEFHGQSATQ